MAVIQFPKNNAGVTALYDGTLFEHKDGTPRLWWVKPSLWAERELVEVITRPIEDQALLNVYLQARALEHLADYRDTLTAHEYQALTLEHRCKRERPHLHGWDVYVWIAGQMLGYAGEWTPRRVKGLLDNVTEIVQAAEMERLLEAVQQRKKALAELKQEARERVISMEQVAQETARAA